MVSGALSRWTTSTLSGLPASAALQLLPFGPDGVRSTLGLHGRRQLCSPGQTPSSRRRSTLFSSASCSRRLFSAWARIWRARAGISLGLKCHSALPTYFSPYCSRVKGEPWSLARKMYFPFGHFWPKPCLMRSLRFLARQACFNLFSSRLKACSGMFHARAHLPSSTSPFSFSSLYVQSRLSTSYQFPLYFCLKWVCTGPSKTDSGSSDVSRLLSLPSASSASTTSPPASARRATRPARTTGTPCGA
mmetsp:Transcript_97970/g.292685  ORF Transcript_97970/g.292685 Transcript_97970/m.292685 type:complete len:247 (-) Transcript_97970:237-977(-)